MSSTARMLGAAPIDGLATGWEPELDGDTFLRRYLVHQAGLASAFALAAGGRVLETPDLVASDYGRPSGYWNAATLLRPPADWDGVLDLVEGWFSGGTGEVVLWSAFPTPDLRPRGWRLSGHPPLLARPPVASLPVPGVDEPGLDIVRVLDEDDLADWEQAAVEGYPLPELEGSRRGAFAAPGLLADERLGLWVGRDRGRPVSAAASFVAQGLASFAFAATVADHRGRGAWHGHARRRLALHPSLWTAGVFSDFSRPLAEHIGFLPLLRLTLWGRDR